MKFHVFQDVGGGWRWRLKVPNGDIVADSGISYATKDECLSGIDLVKSATGQTEVHFCNTAEPDLDKLAEAQPPEVSEEEARTCCRQIAAVCQSYADGQPQTMAPEDGPKAGSALITALVVTGLISLIRR